MRDMTMMFCDIRNFTAIAERFDARAHTVHQPVPHADVRRDPRAGARSTNIWATPSWRSGTRRSTIRLMPRAPVTRRSPCGPSWCASTTPGAVSGRRGPVPCRHSDRHRPQSGACLRREPRLGPALRLFGAGRRREPRFTARRSIAPGVDIVVGEATMAQAPEFRSSSSI